MVLLNHGSYGTCPETLLAAQDRDCSGLSPAFGDRNWNENHCDFLEGRDFLSIHDELFDNFGIQVQVVP
ncbi:hypothetical protein GNE08_18835 [Trichormus variabilis ARAD]|uniref:Uncharacterized protein n=1 Tax=Trichormus variabilis N2B TaxID=2681315 RepID=A0ABR6S7Q1_ANAVA|nr:MULTISPECIES: hypothetical protein [Nostocaceae]MBC1216277.1 hypothetical protein [Trichormus variabilis ARAD]MBC1256325.1 hypothetical protein [Trichormus variabilis V5]MBC1269595.1 hypothetical protein [Trichormus variabilis FSR]MBC1302427.1 hypothetical protein [Trichormus variabilis N2B]MBC1310518.1 hypothetical protein [Trichormus variabilis PNB]